MLTDTGVFFVPFAVPIISCHLKSVKRENAWHSHMTWMKHIKLMQAMKTDIQ